MVKEKLFHLYFLCVNLLKFSILANGKKNLILVVKLVAMTFGLDKKSRILTIYGKKFEPDLNLF